MPAILPSKFLDTELDPGLLSTPFRVQTNWHVITGASCSGKSTLIGQLDNHGFKTVPEVARQYYDEELAKGRTIEDIRKDRESVTIQCYNRMVRNERGLPASEVIFFDRALPDIFVFFRYAGMNPNEFLLDCFQYRYASVFILDRLPYQRDRVRVSNDRIAENYDFWISRDYKALGYNTVRVPVLPPEERLAFVLERLPEE
jgi:predicted ATPase